DALQISSINFAALFFVIEREISVFLKNADLAHPLRTDPARSHVRHTTIFETNPSVGAVFRLAQNRNADRVDALHERADEMQNNFQIVDHQIEHDADVGAAVWIRRKAMRLDKSRMRQARIETASHRIKTLDG